MMYKTLIKLVSNSDLKLLKRESDVGCFLILRTELGDITSGGGSLEWAAEKMLDQIFSKGVMEFDHKVAWTDELKEDVDFFNPILLSNNSELKFLKSLKRLYSLDIPVRQSYVDKLKQMKYDNTRA